MSWETVGLICAVLMPVFNIPLIARIWKRRSSEDISLSWAVGVWVCMAGMVPSGLLSADRTLRLFTIANVVFFTAVLMSVLAFHPVRRRLLPLSGSKNR